MKYIYVIAIVTENKLRVLQRIAGICARNRLNIEQLNVFEGNKGTSYFNVVVHTDTKTMDKVMNQLARIFELLDIKISSQIPLAQNVTVEAL